MRLNIKTVNGFQTEDGKTFATYDAAAAHAKELLQNEISNFLQQALSEQMTTTVLEAFNNIVDAVLDGVINEWQEPDATAIEALPFFNKE